MHIAVHGMERHVPRQLKVVVSLSTTLALETEQNQKPCGKYLFLNKGKTLVKYLLKDSAFQ